MVDSAVLSEPEQGRAVASPGMLYKHYAPKTEAFLVEADSAGFIDFVNSKDDCAAICFEEELPRIAVKKISYGAQNNKAELAKNVFTALREVDALAAGRVYIHAPDKSGIGLAIYNRLLRAAAFKVIEL